MVDDIVAQVVAHRIGVPGGGVEQALDAFRPELADRLGELPAVLALDAVEQTDKIALRALAHLGAGEATCYPLMQRVQDLGPSRDGVRFRTCLLSDHAALLSFGRAA